MGTLIVGAKRTVLIFAAEPAWALVAPVALAGRRFGVAQAAGPPALAAILADERASLEFEVHGQPPAS